jgi:hypothetical protein
MIPKNFEEQLEYGKAFENIIAKWMMNKGYFVTPKYLFTGENDNEAPMMFGKNKKLVIPDIDAAKQGKRIWVECKRKKRMKCHPATGFSTRLYNQYKEVQEITGSSVFIIFWDETNINNEYYGNWINILEQNVYKKGFFIWNKHINKKEPHILFKYPEAFQVINLDNNLAIKKSREAKISISIEDFI